MRILIYTPIFLPSVGGLEYVADGWAAEWTKMGHFVTLVTQKQNPLPDKFSYKVVRTGDFFSTLKLMKNHDVVVMFNISLKAIPKWWLSGTPMVVSHHSALYIKGNWRQNLLQRLKKSVAEYFAIANIACSAHIARDYKNCQVVHSPYKNLIFYDQHIMPRGGEVIFAGRLVSDKGCDILIKAAGILKRDKMAVPVITIVGNGPERQNLEKLAKTENVAEHVFFEGIVTGRELAKQLSNHKVMVVPSRMEPFGIVALEGLACGCKMVVSDTGGLPEAVGKYGHLFISENAASLAKELQNALTGETRLSQEALDEHLTNFTVAYSAKKALQIISEALAAQLILSKNSVNETSKILSH